MITCTLSGRLGNQFYILAMLLAYANKHGLEYHIPNRAYHCDGSTMYFPHMATGPELQGISEYHELTTHATLNEDGNTYTYNTPAYQDIPVQDNIKFVGYWQSFQYFDWCRDHILQKFGLPYNRKWGIVSLHIRRGDTLQLQDKHPALPIEYYHTAIKCFQMMGYNKFLVFSDDIPWCKEQFTGDHISFSEGRTELEDLIAMSECTHNIACYSSFSFIASWLNQNPDKIVIIPEQKYIFSGANADMIPKYFVKLDFE